MIFFLILYKFCLNLIKKYKIKKYNKNPPLKIDEKPLTERDIADKRWAKPQHNNPVVHYTTAKVRIRLDPKSGTKCTWQAI